MSVDVEIEVTEAADNREAIFRKLFDSFGKDLPQRQLKTWLSLSKGWTSKQVETGAKRCAADQNRKFLPGGFGEFSQYLPAKEAEGNLAWYGNDGSWGGDWAKGTRVGTLKAAAIMRSNSAMYPNNGDRRELFYAVARRKSIPDEVQIKGAFAYSANSLEQFLEDWQESQKGLDDE